MNDSVIVVFGSVTSAAYQHLHDAMERRGLRPKIVRFDEAHEYQADSQFLSEAWSLAKKEGLVGDDPDQLSPELDEFVDKTVKALADAYFNRIFGSKKRVNAVKAVIMPYSEYGLNYKWQWVTERLPQGFAEYTVQKSERDGSFWLSGAGYGRSLPNIEVR